MLDVLEGEGLQENALETGRYLSAALDDVASRHECIGDIRGTGFFKAMELVADRGSKAPGADIGARVVNGLCERGVLTGTIGPHDNIVKLRPPMVFGREQADLFIDRLDEVLGAAGA